MAGVVDGQNVQDTALAAAENLITANPDLTAIYATGEPALLGAVAAVESQGGQDRSASSAGTSPPRPSPASTRAMSRRSSSRTRPAWARPPSTHSSHHRRRGGRVIAVPITIVT